MSVALLSGAHINAIASWAALRAPHTPAHVGGYWVKFGTDWPRIARELHRANAAAFTARYGEPVDLEAFQPALIVAAASLSVGQVYELVDALIYQCDGETDWQTSDARGHCEKLRAALAEHLPGRKGAAWTIEDLQHVERLVGLETA